VTSIEKEKKRDNKILDKVFSTRILEAAIEKGRLFGF